MKTLQQVIKKVKPGQLRKLAFKYYDETHDGYEKLLKLLQTVPPEDSKFSISISYIEEEFDRTLEDYEKYHNVSGHTPDDPDNTYSMSFSTWAEWAGMEVEKATIKNYKAVEIAVHCIYEMTFYGWDPKKIDEVKVDLKERCDELDKWIEEGTLDEHTITMDELFDELELKKDK